MVIRDEVPAIVASGIRSLKVFLTYDPLHVDDRQFLRVCATARRTGALVVVHCENYEAINWRTAALIADGRTAPKYHGLKVWGETCPQYFLLHAEDMDRPGFEGAKFMCSPAPRDATTCEALWQELRRGTVDVISSDHSGYSYEGAHGKRVNGVDAPFRDIPNGVPGLGSRLPIVFSEGVGKGRIDVNEFVRLTASNPARLFGLYPRKGTLTPGADADLVLWDPAKRVTIANDLLQHVIDYTPYEGLEVIGWPVATLLRGQVVMRDGRVQAEPGSGQFLARAPYDLIKPTGHPPNGFDAASVLV